MGLPADPKPAKGMPIRLFFVNIPASYAKQLYS